MQAPAARLAAPCMHIITPSRTLCGSHVQLAIRAVVGDVRVLGIPVCTQTHNQVIQRHMHKSAHGTCHLRAQPACACSAAEDPRQHVVGVQQGRAGAEQQAASSSRQQAASNRQFQAAE